METNPSHTTDVKNRHGSIRPYVIGFTCSLVLTIIPYLMVRTEAATGRTLLLSVLGYAILQMFVQIFFFLHLGRGPKPFYNIIFFLGTAGMILLVVGASIIIMDNLYRNMSPGEVTMRLAQDENIAELNDKPTGACQGNGTNHVMTITSGAISPSFIETRRCDTLTLKSGDGMSYMIMFGPEDDPVSYGGQDAVTVRGDRSKIITLNEVGSFILHEHEARNASGQFVVRP